MLQKQSGKYLHGGCGATIDLVSVSEGTIPPRSECGLEIDFVPLYCDKCQKDRQEMQNETFGLWR